MPRKHNDRRGGPAARRIPRLKRMLEGYEERQRKNPNNEFIAAEIVALRWAIEELEKLFNTNNARKGTDTNPAVELGRSEA